MAVTEAPVPGTDARIRASSDALLREGGGRAPRNWGSSCAGCCFSRAGS